MSFLKRFRRQKEDEASRSARLLSTGRITDGIVLDVTTDEHDRIIQIFYKYNVAGVDYESSQLLNEEQQRRSDAYSPGSHVIIRYERQRPGNSVVV